MPLGEGTTPHATPRREDHHELLVDDTIGNDDTRRQDTKTSNSKSLNGAFRPKPFALERFFAQFEFNPNIRHLLCCSDSEPLTLGELAAMGRSVQGSMLREPDTMDERIDLWKDLEGLSLGYTDSAGAPELRRLIASVHYETVSAEEVVVAAPQELVFLTLMALVEHGDLVVAVAPAYQSLHEVCRTAGAQVIPWKPRASDSNSASWRFDVDDLEELVAGKEVKVVIVNAPHNPTGWLPTHFEWQRIVDICRMSSYRGGAYLFSDEMYRFLEREGRSRRLRAAVDFAAVNNKRTISLSGLSKCAGLPGLRIGWIATHQPHLLEKIKCLRDYTTICGSAPSEALAVQALKRWEAIIDRQMNIIQENIGIVEEFMARWKDVIAWETPEAGTVAFPQWRCLLDKNRDLRASPHAQRISTSQVFCSHLAEKEGILLLPGEIVGSGSLTVEDSPPDQVDQYELSTRFRIGYGRKDLGSGLAALDLALQRLFFLEDTI